MNRIIRGCLVAAAVPLTLLAGCGAAGGTPTSRGAPPAANSADTARPVAIIAGQRLDRSLLQAQLAEAAGAAVLEEAVLDAALAREYPAVWAAVGRNDLDRERMSVLALMRSDSGMTESEATEQLERSRIGRGLGPRRFEALLRRNAVLRAAVAPEVSVSADEIRLARDMNFGDRVRAQLLVVRTEREAQQLRQQLLAGADFSSLARARSIDPSAGNGGELGPISWKDPGVPLPLQEALRSTPPGELSPVLALDGAAAIVRVEQRLGAHDTGISDAELEQRIRLRKERIAMDALASRLLSSSSVTVFDESLRWAWETRGR